MPAGVVAAVAGAAAAGGAELPGVTGPVATASRFAAEWIGLRPVAATPTAAEALYEVRDLRYPAAVSGRLRRATGADRELLLSWLPGFETGAGWAGTNPAAIFVTRRLAAGDVWVWDDDGPVSMAARTEAVAGVARIQAVNTPPEQRGRGYASAAVAALSASVLGQGLRCVLIAGLHNVAANSVYRRLGYVRAGEVLRYQFSEQRPRPAPGATGSGPASR